MNIHSHTGKVAGPREKLMMLGAERLTDAELLAIFLGTGTRDQPVQLLAESLLNRFDGLRGLLDAQPAQLTKVAGVGPAKSSLLAATTELSRRYLESGVARGDAMLTPDATRRYLTARLRHYDREVFAGLFLDNQHRLIQYQELFFGTIDGASVHPREVVKQSLRHNAAAVIFAHNHPSGVAEPSQADRRITERLISALALVDVRVLDHMVVGDREVLSMAEKGLM